MAHARLKIARSVAASADIYSGTHCAPWTRAMAAKAASLEDVTALWDVGEDEIRYFRDCNVEDYDRQQPARNVSDDRTNT